MKRVICKSGLEGWQAKLRSNYSSFAEFENNDSAYNLAKRLGYKSAKNAWRYNPTIQGSINVEDFRKVT